ncbi:flagellin [Exiguobacterium acetylicum]|uniref:flagellin N-terminal helical domain-containing protein n=1 Tax=Exiguobacterium acetylicum TaxID=41170 RepID=UPI001EE31860|nr:flagellin [Exiguobacterium acetylicum]UKS55538.1 flagellin [Exiguobacterium acetylicum]
MIINHNITALNTHNKLSAASAAQSKSMEKLASGLRINKAGDDAAGLSISEKMRAQVRGLDQASRNAQDGISMIQTAEGALNEVHAISQRMRELAVQGANETNNSDDKGAILDELEQLETEINRVSKTTAFNDKKLLNGDLSAKLDSTSELKVGTAAGVGSVISAIDVSGALANRDYQFSYDDTTDKLTLTRSGDNVAQTITLPATAGDSKTLSFNELGISLTVSGTTTADLIGAALETTATDTIKTAAGSGAAEFLIGTKGGSDETLSVSFGKYDASTIGNIESANGSDTIELALNKLQAANGLSKSNFENLISTMDRSIKDISTQRSSLGANQNRLEHTINNLKTSSENITAAESRVRDVDMAKEMMNQTKNSILAQAAQAMLAQSNQTPQGVLQLLR